jgi:hypothetical protein
MKLVIRALGFVCSLSVVFACKKTSNDSNAVYNGPKLTKVMVWGASRPSSTIAIYEYHYDDGNRVTRIDQSIGDSANGDIKTYLYDTTTWYYKGNERLPYKNTGIAIFSMLPEKYFYYDNQGRLIRDSVIDIVCRCSYVRTYTWSGNHVMIPNNRPYGGGIPGRVTDSITLNNNNQLSIFTVGIQSQTGRITGSIFTSDNKLNPLHTLNIQAATPFTTVYGFPTVGYSQNNITETAAGFYELLGPNPGSFVNSALVISYKYNYNDHNLPVSCETTGKSPDDQKIIFYYTN